MKISPIYNHNQFSTLYINRNNKVNPYQTPFEGYSYKPKGSFISYFNPLKYYADKLFTNSLTASRRRIFPVNHEIKPYTQTIKIGKSYCWDINKDNREKYIVVLHGLGQNITNLQSLYQEIINKTEHAVLAPEYRGFGENPPTVLSSDTFVEDAVSAYNYLIKDKDIKPENVTVLGHSFGCTVAIHFDEEYQNIKQMILVAPLDSLNIDNIKMNKGLNKRLPNIAMFILKHFNFLKKSLTNIFDTNLHIKNTTTPVSIIHSQNDKTITPESAKRISSFCTNLNQLKIVPNGGHQMESNKINAIIELIK